LHQAVLRRLRIWLRRSRAYREHGYAHPDLTAATRMPWPVRLRMFITGTGAVEHTEDIRGRWLLHRKVMMVTLAVLVAWFIASSSDGWDFFEG
jgi:hypothetical protein